MNNLDPWYQALLALLVSEDQSFSKSDRTGTGTKSLFGVQFRHDMSDGFPLLTTKKMAFKTMTTELIWFLSGSTNIQYLVQNGCHIWDGDCFSNYLKKRNPFSNKDNVKENVVINGIDGSSSRAYTKEELINKIKTDDEFANKWGELGPIYGKQWRSWHWRSEPVLPEEKKMIYTTEGKPVTWSEEKYIDQIANLINELETNPDSRRLMVSAWNVGELDQMVLPPCHYGFQMYTRELSHNERYSVYTKFYKDKCTAECFTKEDFDEANIPIRAISLMWNQRSVDTFLGLPFNIASYGLLLMMIADEVNMVPDQLIGNLGDVHLYNDHVEQAIEQITREPFELPTVHVRDGIESFMDGDIILENYQSHPSIKAPLSN
jgi:thymidylate synthase